MVSKEEKAITRMLRPGDRTAGFTLLEIVIVLVLMGAAALLIAPNFIAGLGSIRLETATRDLITNMKWARSAAVSEQNVRRVILTAPDTPDAPFSYLLTDEFERPLRRVELPEGVSFADPEQLPMLISFYSNGRSSGGTITLVNERGRKLQIEVSPITGFGHLIKTQPAGTS